ncbi:MAG: flagellar assembly protein FliH [OM182 bacterium]|jgi:flagellar biosynthesis/type III secretory pathway protein FliH|nr:flagellar assembly protein FliH [OM182 bacterium]
MILSNRSKPNASEEFVPWLVPKPAAKPAFEAGLDAKVATGSFAIETHSQSSPQADSTGFTVWKPRSLDEEAALAAAANATSAESVVENAVVEEMPDTLEYSQKQLQEYGDNQYQMGMTQARETEAAALTESRHRLEALIATLSEQRVDSSNFYEPLKVLLLKSISAVLHTPLAESRAAVEATLAHLLNEIDKESDGEPTGVRLFLNPADLALLKETEFFIREDIKLAPDESLSRGSMRAMMQDSIIENLTETRIQQVTEQLLSAIGRDEENGEYAQQHNEHESPDTAALISEMAIDEQPVLENEPELQPELEQELQTVLGAEITGEELESDGQPDEFDQ